MEIHIHNSKSGKFLTTVRGLKKQNTVVEVKEEFHRLKPKLPVSRQELRLEQKSKGLKDDASLDSLKLKSGDKLFVKDLGPQIGWSTVFLCEYAGPLIIYLWLSQRPWIFYGDNANSSNMSLSSRIAIGCWSFHYVKRLLETKFVHRFSHGTMPVFNLFKNSFYYWGFALYVAYHVNHPLFTPPSNIQVYIGLASFLICEIGNLSIHLALRNLRAPGTKERRIPYPTKNPFTLLFNFVSCPNYTYEFGAWLSFTVMTQCLPAGLFALCGLYQMAVWALGKHKNYKMEFSKYPKNRKSIIPFLL
ncbi:UNVERIFIED_CONTAM: hypothetical protein RMT77_001205 [Armadillidium vulgare]